MANNTDWRETMGPPFEIPEDPEYDVSEIKQPTMQTPAHAEMFNEIFQRLIINTAAVKKLAESKAAEVSEFEPVETRENIESGDSMAVILGKLSKWLEDLKQVAFSGDYDDLQNIPTEFPPASHDHDGQYPTVEDIEAALEGKSDTDHTHTASQVGAATSNHSHNYAASSSSGGAALNAEKLGGVAAGSYATQAWVQQDEVIHKGIMLSNTGDDATADGSGGKPFKTIGAALKKYRNAKIYFGAVGGVYTFAETITVANRTLLFGNGTWHMKGTIYLFDSNLMWQNCTVNWYAGYSHISPQGVCGFMFGDYFHIAFKALAQDGSAPTTDVSVIHARNSDMDTNSTQCPFMVASAYRFNLGTHLKLFTTPTNGVNSPLIVLWRAQETTITQGAYLYNTSTAMDQIGTSGVYVLK